MLTIRVFVVDDSAFMRKLITDIISEQPDMEVIATARNGQDALNKLPKLSVDVITLDVEMPVMDGLTALQQIMTLRPLPVIMLSSLTKQGSDITMKALSHGAIDFLPKPSGAISLDLHKIADELVTKIRSAYGAKIHRPRQIAPSIRMKPPIRSRVQSDSSLSTNLVVIGSSTGGPRALEEVFIHLPANLKAGILVIQHMPKGFTRSFADRLNGISPLMVKEATNDDTIIDGRALVAPGDYHMEITMNKQVALNQDPPVQYLRPAVDVTMLSVPKVFAGKNIIGVILTGMGRDGAAGMACIKENGGMTIAQDKASSTIYSMPRVVYEEGNADHVVSIDQVADRIVNLVNSL